jgi:hypothetical protein
MGIERDRDGDIVGHYLDGDEHPVCDECIEHLDADDLELVTRTADPSRDWVCQTCLAEFTVEREPYDR